jgi:medium-chain acyl-[acyl-carrier-protein] hydrolase
VTQPPTSTRDPWVVIPRRDPGARLRLFCFPYAGGGASIFTRWAELLPPGVELVAVQLPGRETRLAEKPYSDLRQLVDRLAEALDPYLDLPFACFGHSNGALLAFELTRLLRARGRPLPLHLFVAGRTAPQLQLTDPPIHALPRDEFMAALRRLGGTPEEVLQHAEMMALVEPILRADFAQGETYLYRPEAPLPMPLSAYGGASDEQVPLWQIEAWGEHAGGAFRCVTFPGGHFFLHDDRARLLEEIGRELRPHLARAPHT